MIIDCTASEEPVSHYLEWIEKGIHIITPNKRLGSGPLEMYKAVRKTQRQSFTHWLYEVCTFDRAQNRWRLLDDGWGWIADYSYIEAFVIDR